MAVDDSWKAKLSQSGLDQNRGSRNKEAPKSTVVAQGCRLRGTIELNGSAVIDCAVEGEISGEGELTIGESAVINASIDGETVKVLGRVKGDIRCTTRLELLTGACVTGNISAPRLVIQDGVVFEGRCAMGAGAEESDTGVASALRGRARIVEMPDDTAANADIEGRTAIQETIDRQARIAKAQK